VSQQLGDVQEGIDEVQCRSEPTILRQDEADKGHQDVEGLDGHVATQEINGVQETDDDNGAAN
jgi:hypothetical protein